MSRPHVLYVTYNGLLEPLGLRQGLAYVEALSDRYRFTILSWEKATGQAWSKGRRGIDARLARRGIGWLPLRYHKRPSLPATAFDVLAGARVGRRLARTEGIELIHARGYVSASVAWMIHRSTGVPYLFDVRGLMAEENAESGLWQTTSLRYRLTKRAEHALLRDAAGIVTLTEAVRPYLRSLPALERRPEIPWGVIPCCVDVDEFAPSASNRSAIRSELGVGDRPVLIYVGSVGTWYMLDEMIAFYRSARESVPDLMFLLVVNNEPERAVEALRVAGLDPLDARVVTATPGEVPGYLSAADVGIAFIRPGPSRRASSPTKVGEYLAAGLPVILNAGIGDSGDLSRTSVALVAEDLSSAAIDAVAARLPELLAIERAQPQAVAEREFSIATVGAPRYDELYRQVLARQPESPV